MFSSNTTQISSGGYQISRSLRFNSADSAYLGRTPASAGNRTTWTWSAWVKLGQISTTRVLFSCAVSGTETTIFLGGDSLYFIDYQSGAYTGRLQTTQVLRDISAWYHIVAVWDTTNANAGDRMRLYLNGSEITAFGIDTQPTQNTTSVLNTAIETRLGGISSAAVSFDGYMTEVNFIDGQALTPSSFGQTNADTGVWQPKAYSGSYGTNGFYLNFSDNSNTTATTLGKDYSGNGNNWTPNNFSVTAGAGNDSLVDVPTNWGTDTGAGGSVRGNYATLNPLDKGTDISAANGNLDVSISTGSWNGMRSTFGMQSGKWYCEYTVGSGTYHIVSISQPQATGRYIDGAYGWGYQWDGTKVTNGSSSSYGASFGTGDVIGVAFDADAGTLTFYKNGVSQGTAFSGLTSGPYIVGIGLYPTATGTFNFGQRPFAYTAPSGYKALCTQNLPTPTVGATPTTQAGKYFNPVLYTGTAATQTITGVGFQPDMVWIKRRDNADNNVVDDAVRGAGQALITNSTVAEQNYTSAFTAFASDGFTVTSSFSALNANAATYVAWNWKANGAGSSNTAGSIASTVSANTTSGFSVVTYTGTGSAATVGHGLGVAPSLIIVKARNFARNWNVYHASLGATQGINLNATAAATTDAGWWNNTAPTSTVFTAGSYSSEANTVNYVAYCFAEVPGFSKFGSYTGNGANDGPFVYCGFRPKYVMIKCSSSGGSSWVINDGARNPSNVTNLSLFADLANAENTGGYPIDFCSNGFKIRGTQADNNASGASYIFAAFAETPFKYSLAR